MIAGYASPDAGVEGRCQRELRCPAIAPTQFLGESSPAEAG